MGIFTRRSEKDNESHLGFFLMISPVALSMVAINFTIDAGSFKLW
jgi:hypothetical protein